MGSFSQTCCVSGLPIGAGDAVRWFLLTQSRYWDGGFVCESDGLWVPRTWPIRAKYNDYGSIEDWEDSALTRAILKGLNIDVVEKGVGDNTVHDVAVRKDMSFEDMLTAVWEGRLSVRREARVEDALAKALSLRRVEHFRRLREAKELAEGAANPAPKLDVPVDEGNPTFQRVEVLLTELPHAYHVDAQLEYVRVRMQGYGDATEALAAAAEALNSRYATVIVAGSGHYADSAELLVFQKPGQPRRTAGDLPQKAPLLLQQAMIREDVWQEMLTLTGRGWKGAFTLANYQQGVLQHRAKRDALFRSLAEEKGEDVPYYRDAFAELENEVAGCHFLTRDRKFVFALASHASLIFEDEEADLDAFYAHVAEFTFIHQLLENAGYVWRPSFSIGPQCPEWTHSAELTSLFARVAATHLAEERELQAEWAKHDDEPSSG